MLQIAICDDDRCFAQKLAALLEGCAAEAGEEFKVAVFTDAPAFLSSAVETYDAAFLDVRMGDVNGMEVAEILRQRSPGIALVFVSAYVEYAPQGYHFEALDYLLKNDIEQLLPMCVHKVIKKSKVPTKAFYFHTTSSVAAVCRYDQILYLESVNHNVKLHLDTTPPACHLIYDTLSHVEVQLEDRDFVRIQRSYLVNMCHVTGLKGLTLTLSDGTVLTCSRQKQKEILRYYLDIRGRQPT